MKDGTVYQIGDFSKKTGISIRTLHYYDEIGLLIPHKAAPSGHRVYAHSDIITLQKIVTLKSLGYTLAQIEHMINGPNSQYNLSETLQLQKISLEQKQKQIELSLKAVNRAVTLLKEEIEVDSMLLISIIHSTQHEQEHQEWLAQYISDDTIQKLYSKTDTESSEFDRQAAHFFKEVKRLMSRPVHDPEVQKLVVNQMRIKLAYVDADTGNNSKFSGLTAIEEDDQSKLQEMILSPYSAEEEAWLHQALTYYIEQNGFVLPEEK